MILASVPSDDLDGHSGDEAHLHESREDAALYGHSRGTGLPAKGRQVLRAKALQRIRGHSDALDLVSMLLPTRDSRLTSVLKDMLRAESEGPNFRLALFGVCCCLGIVGIGASISLLQRYASEAEAAQTAEAGQAPLLVIFSYSAPETNAALAWLAARLLAGTGLPNRSEECAMGCGFSPVGPVPKPFIPDGVTVKVWRPPGARAGLSLQALAHGGVAATLQRVHSLGPPRVKDLTQLAGGASALPEADAFLEIRRLLTQAKAGTSPPKSPGRKGDLVLLSHPHHLPYLLALAWASDFEARILDPEVYSTVPWSEFGCGALGYSRSTAPRAGVERELARLDVYVEALRGGDDPQRLTALRPVLDAANATLGFFWCTANLTANRSIGGAATAGAGACLPAR